MNFVHPTSKVEFYEIFMRAWSGKEEKPIQIKLFAINRSAQQLIANEQTFRFDKKRAEPIVPTQLSIRPLTNPEPFYWFLLAKFSPLSPWRETLWIQPLMVDGCAFIHGLCFKRRTMFAQASPVRFKNRCSQDSSNCLLSFHEFSAFYAILTLSPSWALAKSNIEIFHRRPFSCLSFFHLRRVCLFETAHDSFCWRVFYPLSLSISNTMSFPSNKW